ncbi:MAG: DegT/DnrJ/EryC1/StrS family aminotransferase, partial [Rhodospirillum sp.]|nr:DegT/DnrJ/EryC1/StrS family aminotransferase [Rhodospirillum sp.]
IAAVVPVHVFGNPVAMDALVALCGDLGLPVIEDSTEALGSSLDGRGCGSIGRVGTFSFNGNKILTTGGGGALVTNDGDLARRAKHLTTTAKLPHKWAFEHDEVAYNYRLPNLNAAVGCAQLEQLPYFLSLKKDLAAAYAEAFSTVAGVRFHGETKGAARNNWLNTLILDRDVADQRDAILQATHNAGYLTRPIWRLLHFLPMYAECPRADLSVAMDLERRVVNLPSSAWLAPALADETQTAER